MINELQSILDSVRLANQSFQTAYLYAVTWLGYLDLDDESLEIADRIRQHLDLISNNHGMLSDTIIELQNNLLLKEKNNE